jgi:hypothetical protein
VIDADASVFRVDGGSVSSVPVRLRVPASHGAGSTSFEFVAEAADASGIKTVSTATFIAPAGS